jgi:aldose 1-epimerase
MSYTTLDLAAGPTRLRLCPHTGGSIAAFTHEGHNLLRPMTAEGLASGLPRRLGCYPLIPFSGRVAQGRFSFGGENFALERYSPGGPHAIHGNGWQNVWAVEQAEPNHALLALEHKATGAGANAWPFSYRSTLDFSLAPAALTVTVTVENHDSRKMPSGMGLHPYLPRHSDTMLFFRAGAVWLTGPDGIQTERVPVPKEWRFDPIRRVGEPGLDHCFAGWAREAQVVWPTQDLAMTISADPPFGHLVVFTPAGQDFFAVEPVSHASNVLNRLEHGERDGLRILAPGEAMSGSVRFTVSQAPT